MLGEQTYKTYNRRIDEYMIFKEQVQMTHTRHKYIMYKTLKVAQMREN